MCGYSHFSNSNFSCFYVYSCCKMTILCQFYKNWQSDDGEGISPQEPHFLGIFVLKSNLALAFWQNYGLFKPYPGRGLHEPMVHLWFFLNGWSFKKAGIFLSIDIFKPYPGTFLCQKFCDYCFIWLPISQTLITLLFINAFIYLKGIRNSKLLE